MPPVTHHRQLPLQQGVRRVMGQPREALSDRLPTAVAAVAWPSSGFRSLQPGLLAKSAACSLACLSLNEGAQPAAWPAYHSHEGAQPAAWPAYHSHEGARSLYGKRIILINSHQCAQPHDPCRSLADRVRAQSLH